MSTPAGKQSARGRLPVASRDRRPALAALALLLIVGGGLGAGLIVYRTGRQTEVLVANHAIHVGDVVTAGDLTSVRVAGAGEQTIAASNKRAFIGAVAVTNIPSNALLNRLMFHDRSGLLPSKAQVVGIDLRTNQRPAAVGVASGDIVAVYITKQSGGSVDTNAHMVIANAFVYHVRSTGGSDTQHVDLLVDGTATDASGDGATDVSEIVTAAVDDRVAVTLRPAGTKPQLPLTTA